MQEYQNAIQIRTHICDVIEKAIGDQNLEYAQSLSELALLYYKVGNYNKAEELYLKVLQIQGSILGDDHMNYLATLKALSNVYIKLGNINKAEEYLLKAYHVSNGRPEDFASCHFNLASLYHLIGDTLYKKNKDPLYYYNSAEQYYVAGLKIEQLLSHQNEAHFIDQVENVARLYYSKEDLKSAEKAYKSLLNIYDKTGKNISGSANALRYLFMIYYRLGDLDNAESTYQRFVDTQRRSAAESHEDILIMVQNLAKLSYDLGDYAKAELLFLKALDLNNNKLDSKAQDEETILHHLATIYHIKGDYAKAEEYNEKLLKVKNLDTKSSDYALYLANLAETHRELGDYAKAEEYNKKALEIAQASTEEKLEIHAQISNNIGLVYYDIGDFSKAEEYFNIALDWWSKAVGLDHKNYLTSLNNLASTYYKIAHYSMAIPKKTEYYEKSKTIYLKIVESCSNNETKSLQLATTLNSLGNLYDDIGDFSKAEECYLKSLDIRTRKLGEEHPHICNSLDNVGLMYHRKGDFSKAEECYLKSLDIRTRKLGEEHPASWSTLVNLFHLCVTTGRISDAMAISKRVLLIEQTMIDNAFTRSSEQQRMMFLGRTQIFFHCFLSFVLRYYSNYSDAIDTAMDLVLSRKALGFETMIVERDTILAGKYPDLRPKLFELNNLKLQIIKKTVAGPSQKEDVGSHQRLLYSWNIRREKLEEELSRHIPELRSERRSYQFVRQAISEALPIGAALVEFVRFYYYDLSSTTNTEKLQKSAAHYLAFVLHYNDPFNVKMVDLGEARSIEETINMFRKFIVYSEAQVKDRNLVPSKSDLEIDAHKQYGDSLSFILLNPLLKYIANVKQLFISPDGDLMKLPFEVLPMNKDGCEYMIDNYDSITYLSSGRDLLRFKSASKYSSTDPLIIADPDFDLLTDKGTSQYKSNRVASLPAPSASSSSPAAFSGKSRDLNVNKFYFQRLEGTKDEGKLIAELLKVQPLMEDKALKSYVKTCQCPIVLHIATHGFFLPNQLSRDVEDDSIKTSLLSNEAFLTSLFYQHDENPMIRSGLALAGANTWLRKSRLVEEQEDGILTAEDVSSMDLTDTELVVLSACETGLGQVLNGEGVFGLRRAFVLAGAQTLVMSLWKVPDEQTKELMVDFYNQLLLGKPRSKALHEAQLAIKEKYSAPYYWGAFICQGNPGPTTNLITEREGQLQVRLRAVDNKISSLLEEIKISLELDYQKELELSERKTLQIESIIEEKRVLESQISKDVLSCSINIDANIKLGNYYYYLKEYENALGIYNDISKLHTVNNISLILTNKGNILRKIGSCEEALTCYNKALEIDPKCVNALGNKGTALLELGHYDDAVYYINEARDINPNSILFIKDNAIHTAFQKAESLMQQQRYSEAISCYDQVLKIDPKEIAALSNKSIALERLERYEESIYYADKVLEIDPRNITTLLNKSVLLGKHLLRYEESIYYADKVLEIDPRNIGALQNKGAAYSDLMKYHESISTYNRILSIDPNRIDIFFNIAHAFGKLRLYNKAIDYLDKYIETYPNDDEAIILRQGFIQMMMRQ
jgi:tetratricopeptide (TPR) repeat protein